jgi:hypothetical protein
MGDGSLWWIMAYVIVLGTLGIRLLLEMRSCRTSTIFFVLAGCVWAAAIVWQMGLVMPESGARGVMVEEGCEMMGNIVLLLAMSIHARYVLMDVQGLLPEREKAKTKRRRSAESAKSAVDAEEIAKEGSKDAAAVEKRPAAASAGSKPSVTPTPIIRPSGNQARIDPPQDPLEGRRLSKAERRAQRRAAREREEE